MRINERGEKKGDKERESGMEKQGGRKGEKEEAGMRRI